MQGLTTDLLCQACRIFLSLAYPGDEDAIPLKKRVFRELPPGQGVDQFLQAFAEARTSCQPLDPAATSAGYAVRLGCTHYPHLKLKAQPAGTSKPGVWVFAVDTHDRFSKDTLQPSPDHPEAAKWAQLQAANQKLKEQIEHAWEHAGVPTFNSELRRDLRGLGPASP